MNRNRISPDRLLLLDSWHRNYGAMPPKGLSKKTLELAHHYNRQAKTYGGLPAKTYKQMLKITRSKKSGSLQSMNISQVKPGARLVRRWKGQTYVVDILDKGYLWQDQIYGSLSEIARTITGARWSGPRFFGIKA